MFLISDFLFEDNLFDSLKTVSRKHDVVALQISDPAERAIPPAGRVRLEDPETGQIVEVNTNSARFRDAYRAEAEAWQQDLNAQFRRLSVDKIDLSTDREYLPALHGFFKNRGRIKV